MARNELKLAYERGTEPRQTALREDSVERIGKTKTEITVTLANGWTVRGFLFTAPDERISDLLNDAREFVPFLDVGGPMRFLAKRHIVEIRPTQ